MTATPIRTLIVDDEPLARTRLRSLLANDPEITVVGEAGNGVDAINAIESQHPDLVFLDVQMPELDGFGVIEAIAHDHMPLVIFATAYDEYALRAFAVSACDYLLKPIDRDRFAESLRRAKERLRTRSGTPDAGAQLRPLLAHLGQHHQRNTRLAIKSDGRLMLLQTAEIDWLEAEDNNVNIHAGRTVYTVRDTLTRLEHRLPADRFLRIHRSTIVNIDRIREVQPWFQGDYVVLLADGTRLTSGRTYRQRVQQFITQVS